MLDIAMLDIREQLVNRIQEIQRRMNALDNYFTRQDPGAARPEIEKLDILDVVTDVRSTFFGTSRCDVLLFAFCSVKQLVGIRQRKKIGLTYVSVFTNCLT